jgi:hypothetical protein
MMMSVEIRVKAIMAKQPATTPRVSHASQPMGYLRKEVRFMALYETLIPVLFQSITAIAGARQAGIACGLQYRASSPVMLYSAN